MSMAGKALPALLAVILASAVCAAQEWTEDPSPNSLFAGEDLVFPMLSEEQGYQGYARKEFTLPEGKVWKAVADVGSSTDRIWSGERMISALYLNGQLVERPHISGMLYGAAPVNIKDYLRPGTNCAGFYGFRLKGYPPYIYMQATIIMESGETIRVTTDGAWTYSPGKAAGWNEPGFDDSRWQPAQTRGHMFWPYQQNILPAHHGHIRLRNPARKDLFYTDDRDVVVDVLLPPGLADRGPRVEYILTRANQDGSIGEQVAADTISSADERDGSLALRIDLGRREHGVYGLALRLLDGQAQVLDTRPREPVVVLRKLDLQTVPGTEYSEGLDIELEDTVDFTDPQDPHPWIEGKVVRYGEPVQGITEPRIVRKDGLVYREVTGAERGSYFTYRIEFEHPGDFYMLEFAYPDDADRVIAVSISTKVEGVWTNSQTGVGAETGGKFYNTGQMQTLRWIHVADEGVHSVDVMNQNDGWNAAAHSLKIYHVRGSLPSVATGTNRHYGIHTERCNYTSGIGMGFGIGGKLLSSAEQQEEARRLSVTQRILRDLVWLKDTSERYAQYLRFSGQNLHLMGCVQYTRRNTPFVPADPQRESATVLPCPRTMLANVLDINDISFLTGIEFSQPATLGVYLAEDAPTQAPFYVTDEQVAAGMDTLWRVDAQGRQRTGLSTYPPNWQHVVFREAYTRVVHDLVNTFGHLDHFLGVSNFFSPAGHPSSYYFPAYASGNDPWDQPLQYSYDDVTFANFAADTGVDLSISPDDPDRFAKRAEAVSKPPLRRQFLDWRCRKLYDFFAEVAGDMTNRRADLQFVNVLAHVEVASCFEHLVDSDQDFDQMMQDFGIDLGALGQIPNTTIVRWTNSWRQHPDWPQQNPYCWIPAEREVVLTAFEDLPHRGVLCRTSWDENNLSAPGHAYERPDPAGSKVVQSDWVIGSVRTRIEPQPAAYHAREAYLQAIVSADPQLLLGGFTDLVLNLGNEQILREVLAPYTHLPRDRFETVLDTGLQTNLAIRKLNTADGSWLYIANPGYWRIRGTVELAAGAPVRRIPTADEVAQAGEVSLPVDLAPFGLVAYRVDSPQLEVASYATEPITERELLHMRTIMGRVNEAGPNQVQQRIMRAAYQAIQQGEYARAWHLIKDYRFWPMNN